MFSRKERKERKDDSRVEESGLDGRAEHVDRVEGRGFDSRVEGERERDEFSRVERVERVEGERDGSRVEEKGELHLLYLGRRHPLKGVEYLEKAVAELNSNPVNPVNPVQNSSARSTRSTRLNNPAFLR